MSVVVLFNVCDEMRNDEDLSSLMVHVRDSEDIRNEMSHLPVVNLTLLNAVQRLESLMDGENESVFNEELDVIE